jgi:hypothetical protein
VVVEHPRSDRSRASLWFDFRVVRKDAGPVACQW